MTNYGCESTKRFQVAACVTIITRERLGQEIGPIVAEKLPGPHPSPERAFLGRFDARLLIPQSSPAEFRYDEDDGVRTS
jgi:hypothetical protein